MASHFFLLVQVLAHLAAKKKKEKKEKKNRMTTTIMPNSRLRNSRQRHNGFTLGSRRGGHEVVLGGQEKSFDQKKKAIFAHSGGKSGSEVKCTLPCLQHQVVDL